MRNYNDIIALADLAQSYNVLGHMGHFIDAAFHNNTELINSINKDPCKLLIAAKKLRYERLYNDYFIFVLVQILSRDTPRSRT